MPQTRDENRFARVLLVSVIALLGSTAAASAYIDPNAGTLITQILAPLFAVVAGAWIVAKEKFMRLFSYFRRRPEQLRDNQDI